MKGYVRLVADNRHLPCATNSWTIPLHDHIRHTIKIHNCLEALFRWVKWSHDVDFCYKPYFQAGYWRTDTVECPACLLHAVSALNNDLLEGRNQEGTPLQNMPWTCLFNFNINEIHSVISVSSWLMKLYKSPKVFSFKLAFKAEQMAWSMMQ